MGRVVVLGSLNVDLVATVERHPGPGETVLAGGSPLRFAGGKGGNQAVAAAAAGARVRVTAPPPCGSGTPGAWVRSRPSPPRRRGHA
jgi:ribokinase